MHSTWRVHLLGNEGRLRRLLPGIICFYRERGRFSAIDYLCAGALLRGSKVRLQGMAAQLLGIHARVDAVVWIEAGVEGAQVRKENRQITGG